jgi:hypothetical protein
VGSGRRSCWKMRSGGVGVRGACQRRLSIVSLLLGPHQTRHQAFQRRGPATGQAGTRRCRRGGRGCERRGRRGLILLLLDAALAVAEALKAPARV